MVNSIKRRTKDFHLKDIEVEVPRRIGPYDVRFDQKESHLHAFKPKADASGNRAERRQAAKQDKKKKK